MHYMYTFFFVKGTELLSTNFTQVTQDKKQSLYMPWGFHEVQAPRFRGSRHVKVVSPRNRPPLLISVKSLSQLQCHSADERFMSMKNSSDTIRNRNRDLPACNALPQPTASLRDPYPNYDYIKIQSLPHKKHSAFPLQLPAGWCPFGK